MRFRHIMVLGLLFLLFSSSNIDDNISVLSFADFEPHLSFQNDTVYVINFWATWCAPCVKELPYFNQAHSDFKDKKVKLLLVSLDFPNQLNSRLIPFVEKNGIQPEVILLNEPNANKWIDKVDPSWSGAIPATLIYKKDQRTFHEGELDKETLYKLINKHL